MITIILYFILSIILLKYLFIFCTYVVSVIYFYFLNKSLPIRENKSIYKQNKKTLRYILSRYINGFVFYSLLQTGKIPFHSVRNFIYRHFYKVNMEEDVIIYSGVEMRSPHRLTVGKGSIIGHYSILDARNFIEIGQNVNFSNGVWLWTEQHNYNDPYFGCESPKEKNNNS